MATVTFKTVLNTLKNDKAAYITKLGISHVTLHTSNGRKSISLRTFEQLLPQLTTYNVQYQMSSIDFHTQERYVLAQEGANND